MTVIRKAVQRTVRLDDDVWQAVKAMPCSLNRYLRTALLDHPLTAKGMTTLATPDATAKREPLPTLDAIGPELSSGRGKATTETYHVPRGLREKGDVKR